MTLIKIKPWPSPSKYNRKTRIMKSGVTNSDDTLTSGLFHRNLQNGIHNVNSFSTSVL